MRGARFRRKWISAQIPTGKQITRTMTHAVPTTRAATRLKSSAGVAPADVSSLASLTDTADVLRAMAGAPGGGGDGGKPGGGGDGAISVTVTVLGALTDWSVMAVTPAATSSVETAETKAGAETAV